MNTEHVVVLHGILRTRHSMRPVTRALKNAGYVTHDPTYPSRRLTLCELTDWLHTWLSMCLPPDAKVHFVTYSMGGLLARAYIHRYRPKNLGRVVQIAPPNTGSEGADALMQWPPYRFLYGPAGQQLGTKQEAIAHLFGPVDFPLCVIAGNASWNPVFGRHLPGAHDGKVAVERTKLDGMAEHHVIPAPHTFIMHYDAAHQLLLGFLKG